MSELDNLQDADGKQEKEITFNAEESANQSVDIDSKETSINTPLESEKPNPTNKTSEDEPDVKEEEHVDEIDASNAEDAEDEDNKERHHIKEKDYHSMSMEALVKSLEELIKNYKIQTISQHVNQIKGEFNSKYAALLEEKKDEFINDGGNPIDFYYTNDTKKAFNSAYREYKEKIATYYKDREQSLKVNLKKRLEIIEEIKGLINVEENINTTYKHFKELQESWRNAGPIPRDKYNNAWNSYHHHVERFYDFLHLNRDLRDLDFKHNLEQKLKIIEQAEALAEDANINRSFRELQALHKLWKEELGPVAKAEREAIWERFSKATKIIHEKRQAYYADMEQAYEKNLIRKEEIIGAIEKLLVDANNSHGGWQKKIKQLEALRTDFFNAGKVPLKVNEATWAKFKEAVRNFNRSKNQFYKNLKKDQFDNLQKKRELIKIAEDNKDSDDFESITPLMKKIQNDWKKIGHVPRRDSDKIWKQFKDACNHYFDRLHASKKAENQHLYDALDKKNVLLDELKGFKTSKDKEADVEKLKAYIDKWKESGMVPRNKRFIEGKFSKAIDEAFGKLDMDRSTVEMLKFESKLETLTSSEEGNTRALDNEQNFIRKKIEDVKSEINQLENNLQFFSNVKDDNPLVKDVHSKIDAHKQELDTWKSKLKKVRSLYKSE
ncbi:DUF349 domain-containing protein [Winogradskyella aurantiaca]|uniref:DUF349 domain-containing protein n=1 Tax=Winogradskyella aurantiaca TaxID=2219558 RepID=UPI000E1C60D1|nr:DUF349 domain-containing protein [Winogradskyella aurantiaca]